MGNEKPKFLSAEGLVVLKNWILSLLSNKVDKVAGKQLSTNDYTDSDRDKLANVQSGAQVNVIESIAVNGDSQVIDNKTVNIAVPVNNNELINGAGYQTSSDVEAAITTALADVTSISYHICESNEYNHSTYIPTLVGAIGVIYLVPKPTDASGDALVGSAVVGTDTVGHENVEANNIYYEYIYNGLNFEKIGDTAVDLTGYLQDADIATASDVNAMLQEIGIIS